MATVDLSQLTAVVQTFAPPKSLDRLVRSVRKQYPQLRVLAADDCQQPVRHKDRDYFRLPANTSRGAGRNALLARVRTPYFLLLDDQSEFHRDTQIEPLLQLVAEDKLDLAAGSFIACRREFWVFTRRQPQPNHGTLEFAGDRLTLEQGHRTAGDGYFWCDLVGDFFVARTDKVRALGGWDPELMQGEREEFFVRAHHHGLRVGIRPDITLWQWNELPQQDVQECRQLHPKALAVAKMGLAQMMDFDGQVIKAARHAQAA